MFQGVLFTDHEVSKYIYTTQYFAKLSKVGDFIEFLNKIQGSKKVTSCPREFQGGFFWSEGVLREKFEHFEHRICHFKIHLNLEALPKGKSDLQLLAQIWTAWGWGSFLLTVVLHYNKSWVITPALHRPCCLQKTTCMLSVEIQNNNWEKWNNKKSHNGLSFCILFVILTNKVESSNSN